MQHQQQNSVAGSHWRALNLEGRGDLMSGSLAEPAPKAGAGGMRRELIPNAIVGHVDDSTSVNKPLDWDLLVRRCLGRLDLAERLLKSFESRFPEDLERIEDCLGSGDPVELARLVHQLKGSAANISAPDLYDIMSRLELAVRAEQRDAAWACVAEAHQAWDRYLEFQCSSIHRSNS
jgi:HPt (histidine-containing phosphotransfer) domain-containing protein